MLRGRRARRPPCWRLRDPPERRDEQRLSLHVCQRGGRAGGAGGHRARHAGDSRPTRLACAAGACRHLRRRSLARRPSPASGRTVRCKKCSAAGPRPTRDRWCSWSTRIDALVGDTLLSVLRQLRSGYDLRPEGFPHSVLLCGVRDVRDYRIRSGSEQGRHRRWERLQHQGTVATSGGLLEGRGGSAVAAAHGGGPGSRSPTVRSMRSGRRRKANPGSSMPWRTRPASGTGKGGTEGARVTAGPHPRRAGAAHRASRDAPGPTRGQAPGRNACGA